MLFFFSHTHIEAPTQRELKQKTLLHHDRASRDCDVGRSHWSESAGAWLPRIVYKKFLKAAIQLCVNIPASFLYFLTVNSDKINIPACYSILQISWQQVVRAIHLRLRLKFLH